MVKFRSKSGHVYEVSAHSCSCPDYTIRQARVGGKCKHMIFLFYKHLIPQLKVNPAAAKQGLDVPTIEITKEQAEYFKAGVPVDEAFERWGDETIQKLVDSAEIINFDNKFILLR